MPSRSLAALAALLALLLLAVPAASHGPVPVPEVRDSTGLQSSPTPTGTPTATPAPDPEHLNTTFRVTLQEDGDARWRVEATFDRTDSFESFATRFENEETVGLGYDSFQTASDRAEAATGREMNLRNVQRTSTVDNGTGTLVLAFTWSNFARTEGDLLAVDDAFTAGSDRWLPELRADQSLVIVPPRGYSVQSAPIGVTDGVARWDGPRTFTGDEPWIVYERGTVPTPSTTTVPSTTSPLTSSASPTTTSPASSPPTAETPTTGTSTTTDGGPGDGLAAAWPVALLVLLAAAGVAAYSYRDEVDGVGGSTEDGDDGATGAAATAAATQTTSVGDSTGDSSGAGAGAAAIGDNDAGDDEIDETLLSDEERVERLLERNGGRMKQATIVKETGWSNAKVSQLLSSMAEEERIDKLRIGRENLISFPDEDLTDLEE